MSETTLLSIVIPVFNNWKFTRNCCEHFQKLDSKFEVIIVDNNSSDETEKEIVKYLDKIKYERRPYNSYYAGGCNWGYLQTESKAVMFLNNDIKFGDSNNLNINLELMTNKLQPNVIYGPTAGCIDLKTGKFQYETEDFAKPFNYISGWCMVALTEVWEKLMLNNGPFDIAYDLYFEETDLCMRANQLSIKLEQISVPFKHIGRKTASLLPETNALFVKSNNLFKQRWVNK